MKCLRIYNLVWLLMIALLLGCQKKPNASFTTNKDVYSKGEQITVSNISTNAYRYAWILKGPTEIRSDAKEPIFLLQALGTYELSLSCYSKYNKFINKVSKTIFVKSLEGSVVFYKTNSANHYYINENIGSFFSTLSVTFNTAPQCGDAGTVTYKTSAGQHLFTINNDVSNVVKQVSVNIIANGCTKQWVNF